MTITSSITYDKSMIENTFVFEAQGGQRCLDPSGPLAAESAEETEPLGSSGAPGRSTLKGSTAFWPRSGA